MAVWLWRHLQSDTGLHGECITEQTQPLLVQPQTPHRPFLRLPRAKPPICHVLEETSQGPCCKKLHLVPRSALPSPTATTEQDSSGAAVSAHQHPRAEESAGVCFNHLYPSRVAAESQPRSTSAHRRLPPCSSTTTAGAEQRSRGIRPVCLWDAALQSSVPAREHGHLHLLSVLLLHQFPPQRFFCCPTRPSP